MNRFTTDLLPIHQDLHLLCACDDETLGLVRNVLEEGDWVVQDVVSVEALQTALRGGGARVVCVDQHLPGVNAALLNELLRIDPEVEFLLLGDTPPAGLPRAISCVSRSALADVLPAALKRTRRFRLHETEEERLRQIIQRIRNQGPEHRFIGVAPRSLELIRQIEKIAAAPNATVLILGETGSGKEVAARLIHQLSRPRTVPLHSIHCGSMNDTQLEIELYGQEKGFSGAERRVSGLLEMAQGGTILLDGIGDLSLPAQSRILRVLEERRFRRLGGVKEIAVDVRLIATTSRDLGKDMEQGRFRPDLFYRLGVATLSIPPLRERAEDILPLARFFLELFMPPGRRLRFSPAAEKHLQAMDFPGNIRDLRNLVERATIFVEGNTIRPVDLSNLDPRRLWPRPEAAVPSLPPALGGTLNLHEAEKCLILQALKEYHTLAAAARALGVTPQALYRKLEKHGIPRHSVP